MQMSTSLKRFWCIFLATLGASSCGWKVHVVFRSPSGKSAIELEEPRMLPQDFKVIVVSGDGDRHELQRLKHEMALNFAYAYWSQDEERVAILACGVDRVQLAYNL